VAAFAFTVHPDEKDVRVAIKKQQILPKEGLRNPSL
jgi:hypothetical protein